MRSLLTEKYVGELCVVCEQSKPKGIHLYTSFICTDCEREIIQSDMSDPKYKYYLHQLKKITLPDIPS